LSRPTLIIVAGCNGSGKSTFSNMHHDNITPFDYDKKYLETFDSLDDSELRDVFAKNKTTSEFESSIKGAFSNRKDFCYETNFDSHPILWALQAKELGYNLELYFYCLKDLELANERVAIRKANKGHFINSEVVHYKWKEGYKNLNLHYHFFDHIYLLDNSQHMSAPKGLFSLTKKEDDTYMVEKYITKLPSYSYRRFPDIYKLVTG